MSFFERKADTVALTTGAILGILIIAAYIWGVGDIASHLDVALDPDTGVGAAPTYNLEAAGALDLKGLSAQR